MTEREFSARVRAMQGRLWRVSYAILCSGADCDDALQETLLRAWRQLGGLKDERLFETWLTRILINECRRLLKKRGVQPQALPESLGDVPEADNRALHDAICTLPLSLRLPLTLYYIEGYAVREVAKLLHLPETTVKWRLNSARKKLRNEMSGEADRA